jgi:transcriptional regulator with XRE-family HTH domain
MCDIKKKIGYEIRNIRVKLNLTQKQFTELFNETDPKMIKVTQADVSRYELAQVSIPAEKLEKFRSLIKER